MDNNLIDGFKAMSPAFVKIGGTSQGFYLSEIVPSGADKMTGSENTISLQTLDSNGIPSHYYMYHKGDSTRSYKEGDGWYEDKNFIGGDTDVEIKAGEAVWVSGNASLKLTIVTPHEDAE